MVTSVTAPKAPNIFAAPTDQQDTASESTTSFTDQLSAALGSASGNSTGLPTDKSQDSGVRQLTAMDAPAVAAPLAQAPSAQAAASDDSNLDDATKWKMIQDENNAYWAAQPPEVQQLRDVGDFAARMSMAQQLASKGYNIDLNIMVRGYDPLKTMVARQIYGYTWTPGLNQPLNSPPPGFSPLTPGESAYDPSKPAQGSIAVDTSFADGLGIKDVFALG